MTAAEDAETAPRRGYRKGAERRVQILDEMIRMVAEQGVDASSLRSVAEALGITHAALRHYFPSRDELLLAVYREHEVREQGAPDRLESAIGDMRESAGRNRDVPGLVQLYTTLSADAVGEGHPSTREFMRERFARLRSELADLIRRDQEAGRIRADLDPTDLASLSIAASDGLQVQWLLDPDAVDGERVLSLLEHIVPPAG
ncbi:TetR family transcriptional regulator [Curtobacterium sp. PhB130]|uniref:TetR/AcrR family transcriptional regulator n=1 Tax=unclassified Curtobacterium TaxID=257496 RepID=UPI000F4C3795|nr:MULTISPECIES: TetR/AcrR family transcriptional regulator [unclassified Curtobacterium]ROS77828.1 TetR family transcriptional regulator [Curtobacterium sp. PhB130]TCK65957.1 TetR family transcriptional regulator [Curtobacterium sp. PhB136]